MPSPDEIAAVAFRLYEERERLCREDWYKAEREVLNWAKAPGISGRLSHETIAGFAYRRWEDRKGVNGSAQSDWERAAALLEGAPTQSK